MRGCFNEVLQGFFPEVEGGGINPDCLGLSQILVSALQGYQDNEKRERVAAFLKNLNEEDIGVLVEFYQIRKQFKNGADPEKVRRELNQFIENHPHLPEEGLFPVLLRAISYCYPDPEAARPLRRR